jgi:hypothetical protein
MGIENRLAGVAAMMCAMAALTACGGGSGSSAPVPAPPPPAPAPAPTLTLSSGSPNGQAVEGGATVAITLAGATVASGAVTWSLSPSIGTLSGTSAIGASYTPPAAGGLSVPTVVTITATPIDGSAAALQFTITLMPFGVTGTTPAAGDRVDVSAQPTIQFTRALASAPSASSATLASPVVSVPVSIAASGATLTLSPKAGLVWGGHYTVSLTSDIVSAVGQALAPTTYSFDVAAPSWTAPTQLAAPTFTTGTPVVAFDKSGHAFAVWQQDTDGTGTWNIQAARFDLASRAWSASVPLRAGAHAQVAPVVATDTAGNAIAAWCENTGNFVYNVYAARFVAAVGSWGQATLIQTVSSQTGQVPQVVLDAAGDGTVVWQQYSASGLSLAIYAARFDATTTTWSSAIELDPGSGAGNPQVALDASGNAAAVWEQSSSGAVAQIAAARWSQSSRTWAAAQVLQTSALRGSNPQLAVAANGDATVVWTQTESNGTLTIQASHLGATTGSWSPPVALSPATGVNGGNWPQAQADPAGNVIVLWQQYQSIGVYSMDAARYDVTSGQWGAPVHIVTLTPAVNTSPFAWAPTLVVDPVGNATATWTYDVGGSVYNAFQARFDSHTGTWGVVNALSGSVTVADRIFTTVDIYGDVLATWGVRDIYDFQTPWWALLSGS